MNSTRNNIQLKKAPLLFTVLVYLSSVFYSAGSTLSVSDSAIYYYDNKNYAASAACYEKILSEGRESWLLHYNLGNAYYKSEKLGNAILHYEMARKLNPNQPDLLNNLRIADSKMQDKMEVKENFLEREIRLGIIHLFTLTGWAWISIASLALSLALFFLYRISPTSALRKISFWSATVISLVFIFSMLCGFNALREKNKRNSGVITAAAVNFYNEPRSENKKNFQLHEGTRVKILLIDNGWLNVQLQNGNEGWIKATDAGLY